MLSAEELNVLDDFRFKIRMPSRAAAIRELLRRGLAAEGFEVRRLREQIRGVRRDRQGAAGTAQIAMRTDTVIAGPKPGDHF